MSLLSWLRGGRRDVRGGEEAGPPAGGATARYVAIIMDGNGRWAQRRRLPVAAGHRAGAKALRRVVEHAIDCDIAELTVYSFSTENWARSRDEVDALMQLFREQIAKEVPEVQGKGVRVRFVGRRDDVPVDLLRSIEQAEAANPPEPRMTLFIAFNYGARDEILHAVRALMGEQAGEVDEAALRRHLYAPDMHDPELLVRTSGEQRISNFLLWQLAYTELYFTDTLWPDFGPADLDEALAVYAHRARRFGVRADEAGAAETGDEPPPQSGEQATRRAG